MELLVTISTQQSFLQTMNSTLDFSFIDTNRTDTPITNATTIIPRQAEPNVNLPAYLDGRVAWGGVPIEVSLIVTVQAYRHAVLLHWTEQHTAVCQSPE